MSVISQLHHWASGAFFKAENLEEDLVQLYGTINNLDADNLYSGTEFDFQSRKLVGLLDPAGVITDGNDLQAAVTKAWIKAQLIGGGGLLDPASGNWHIHANKAAVLDVLTDAGSGIVISTAERNQLPTANQKAGLDASPTPITGANPVASIADVTGVSITNVMNDMELVQLVDTVTSNFVYQADTKSIVIEIEFGNGSNAVRGRSRLSILIDSLQTRALTSFTHTVSTVPVVDIFNSVLADGGALVAFFNSPVSDDLILEVSINKTTKTLSLEASYTGSGTFGTCYAHIVSFK